MASLEWKITNCVRVFKLTTVFSQSSVCMVYRTTVLLLLMQFGIVKHFFGTQGKIPRQHKQFKVFPFKLKDILWKREYVKFNEMRVHTLGKQ